MEEAKTSKAMEKLTLFVALVVGMYGQAQRTDCRAATVLALIVNNCP